MYELIKIIDKSVWVPCAADEVITKYLWYQIEFCLYRHAHLFFHYSGPLAALYSPSWVLGSVGLCGYGNIVHKLCDWGHPDARCRLRTPILVNWAQNTTSGILRHWTVQMSFIVRISCANNISIRLAIRGLGAKLL